MTRFLPPPFDENGLEDFSPELSETLALEAVRAVYAKTPEIIEKQAVLDCVSKDPQFQGAPSEAHTLMIPKEIRYLWDYVSRITDDKEPGHDISFHNFVVGAIEQSFQLWIYVMAQEDERFGRFRRVWNRICDEQGHPELKRYPPMPTAPDTADDIPF